MPELNGALIHCLIYRYGVIVGTRSDCGRTETQRPHLERALHPLTYRT